MDFIPGLQDWLAICNYLNVIHSIKKGKDKNYMILSTDAEKAFGKIQHLFLMKTQKNVEIELTFLNNIKAINKISTPVIILNGEELSVFPLKSGT